MGKLDRRVLLAAIVAGSLWLIYLEKSVFTTLVLAAGFSYLLRPLVQLLSRRLKLAQPVAATLVFLVFVGLIVGLGLAAGSRMVRESEDFTRETRIVLRDLEIQAGSLPDWAGAVILDSIGSARSAFQLAPRRFIPYFPGLIGKIIYVFAFFFALFYFLKDGEKFLAAGLRTLPKELQGDLAQLLSKINKVLGDYLRAELLLVLIMSTLTFIGLSLLSVRYALILAVFTGFAELVPYVGPVLAGSVAVIVAYFDGVASLGLAPVPEMLVVAGLYFFLRQMEDLFIIPHVLGRMTRLHPLVVLIAVLAGGELWGAVGFVAAVPLVASARVILEYLLVKTAQKE